MLQYFYQLIERSTAATELNHRCIRNTSNTVKLSPTNLDLCDGEIFLDIAPPWEVGPSEYMYEVDQSERRISKAW